MTPLSRRALLAALVAGAVAGCGARRPAATGSAAGTRLPAAGGGRGPLGAGALEPQHPTPSPSSGPRAWGPPNSVRGLGTHRDGLLVLAYHDVTADGRRAGVPGPDPFTVRAADLADHLAMLASCGFRSVGLADVVAARRGRPLPPRSLLITFDDGGSGQWSWADPLLQEYGFTAATFLITSYLDGPGCLRWAEVRAMAANGRWEVGDHTHADHHLLPSGPGRPRASMLVNRVWDPVTRSLESHASAVQRVRTDLRTSLAELAAHGLPRPVAFAYPFSQVDGPTNDPALAASVRSLLGSTFPVLLTNSEPGRLVGPADLRAGLLPRLEVHNGDDADRLLARIEAAKVGGLP